MTMHRNLALLGLPPFDRYLLEHLLLGEYGEGGFVIVHDLHAADLVISNADDGNVVRNLKARGLAAPVLLIGDSDAGTGWPLLARPVTADALVMAIGQLTMAPARAVGAAPAPSASPVTAAVAAAWRSPAAGFEPTAPFSDSDFPPTRQAPLSALSAPAGGVRNQTPPSTPGFQATVPFAALEMPGVSVASVSAPADSAAGAKSIETRHVASPATGPIISMPRQVVPPDLAQEVLMWRDGPPAPPVAAPVSPPAAAPARADLDSYWTSNLAEATLDHPTLPQALGGEPSASILLVGGPRLSDGSLMKALRGFGHRVDHAPDGGGALSRLAARDYGFVFLDQAALGVSTLSVCRTLRRHESKPRVVVIAAKGSWLQRLLANSAGVDAWMIKPLVKKRLQHYLRKRIVEKLTAPV